MAKDIIYDNDAQAKLLAGIEKIAKAVGTTLGPAGRNVIIDEYGSIHCTRDGVSVAKSITLKDPFENLGANAIKEVAEKSNKNCGDGTTTSTILASAIYKNGLKYVALGSNATQLKNGIMKAANSAIDYVNSISKPISTRDDVHNVAYISANGDKNIADTISDVLDKLGADGTVKVEDGQTAEMTSKIVEGMVLDVGFVSPYMATNSETMEADLDNPFVLIAGKKLSNLQDMLPCLQSVSQTGRPLLVIADDFQEDVISSIIMNRLRGTLNAVLVKSPSYGDNRKAILDDIAIMCGAAVVSDETGVRVEQAIVDGPVLGQAKRVLIKKDSTVIFDGVGNKDAIDERANSIRAQIETTTSDYDKDKLKERLARLVSGIGVISVGADTEAERKELRDRVDDAFCAAKSAIRSGIVAGGGSTLLMAAEHVKKFAETLTGEEKVGAMILQQALSAPARKIVENAGLDSGYIVNKIIDDTTTPNCGFNVLTGEYVNMIDAGIIDPTEVVVNEIRNAVSVSSLLITTDALVVEAKDETKQAGTPAGMPGMM